MHPLKMKVVCPDIASSSTCYNYLICYQLCSGFFLFQSKQMIFSMLLLVTFITSELFGRVYEQFSKEKYFFFNMYRFSLYFLRLMDNSLTIHVM